MKIESFKDLIVWQKSMELCEFVYKLTKDFPKDEMYSLTSQMRRSAVSIPSNIAEGNKRGSTKEYKRFLRIAYSSSAELETQILLSKRIYQDISIEKELSLLTEIQKILSTIIRRME